MFIKRLPRFEYHSPSSIDEAVNQLAELGDKGKLVAGGTDLSAKQLPHRYLAQRSGGLVSAV